MVLKAAWVVACVAASAAAMADDKPSTQLDPFAQATRGDPSCAQHAPPLLTPEQAQAEAHARVERGTRCGMEGTCEPGGAYRRDAEINERVRAAIASDGRFAATSIWLTTSRKWVTLQGCVRNAAQRRSLVEFVRKSPGVERVFDELTVVAQRAAPPRSP
jgi:osmotically-inducible protein OsmY